MIEVILDDYDEAISMVDIDFVDFGDYQRKPVTDVADLRADFLKLPFQAIECTMADLKPKEYVRSV